MNSPYLQTLTYGLAEHLKVPPLLISSKPAVLTWSGVELGNVRLFLSWAHLSPMRWYERIIGLPINKNITVTQRSFTLQYSLTALTVPLPPCAAGCYVYTDLPFIWTCVLTGAKPGDPEIHACFVRIAIYSYCPCPQLNNQDTFLLCYCNHDETFRYLSAMYFKACIYNIVRSGYLYLPGAGTHCKIWIFELYMYTWPVLHYSQVSYLP